METEIKLRIDRKEDASRLLADQVLFAGMGDTLRLRAAYFDTPDLALGRARVGLRLREENGVRMATLKFGGDENQGLHRREEVNVVKPEGSVSPDDFPAQQRMLAELIAGRTLIPVARTDIERRVRTIRRGESVLELALDAGTVSSQGRSEAVLELEAELLEGPPEALDALRDDLVRRYGLVPEPRSKLARGLALYRSASGQQA